MSRRLGYAVGFVSICVAFACTGSSEGDPAGADAGSGASTGAGTGGASGGTGGASSGVGGASGGTSAGGASGGSAGSAGSAGAAGSAGGPNTNCANADGYEITVLSTTAIADMGTPFDPDEEDDVNPFDWNTNYGKPPEIIALPNGENVDILWQDSEQGKAFVVHVTKQETSYEITQAYEVPIIDRIMGFARDEEGNYYYATGIDEDDTITLNDPPEGVHRSDIVRVVKFAPGGGCALLNIDVDLARETAEADSEAIINPMVAASSRLAYSGGQLALVHGINTPSDGSVRHQKALTTHLDGTTGAVTRTDSMWVSHSFDQRLFWDGSGFVETHLGDAYPRAIAFARFTADDGTDTYELFRPKGAEGANSTYTRLGGVAPIATGDYGYLVVFTTDRNDTIPGGDWSTLAPTRDLAFVRVRRNFDTIDPDDGGFIDESGAVLSVMSSGQAVDNHLTWLTDYAGDQAQADRSRVVAIDADQFVVLWERWNGNDGNSSEYDGTYALVMNGAGTVTGAATKVGDHHISRGDDAVAVGGRALFVTGNAPGKQLLLNFVASDLTTETVTLP